MQANRKKLIINYANVSPELMEAIRKKYPLGWINNTIKVPLAGGAFFYAITLDTEEASYLIKVPVKVDTKTDKDEDFFDTALDLKETDDRDEEEEEKEKIADKDIDE
ncbi:MAG: hypothetical protein U0Z17_03355 [Bacteroidales bacterium]